MKKLLISRILACLIFLTIWGSKTYAQGSTSSIDAGTETFKITSNTRINSQKTEYQYYASANISLFIGADEVWKNDEIYSGKYYLSSGGNMGIKQDGNSNQQTKAGYYEADQTTGNSDCIALPNTGNYFHFLFHTKGKIRLAFNVKYSTDTKKSLYVAKATTEPVTVVYKRNDYTTRRGITPSSINVTATTTETTIDPQKSGDNQYFKISGAGGDHPMDIVFNAEAGDEYCIWMTSAEEFALGGFTFKVDDSQRFTPWTPVVHRQIEFGKSPKDMENADAKAPSGVEDITFMYGGWTNHTNAVKAATWDAIKRTWGFNDNGNENTTSYRINNEQKIDKWETVKAESETTEKLVTLDGYGKFTAGCGQVPTDQYGKAYTPTTSAAPSVANIPCRGTYYKFEPAKDGTLNIYVRQAADRPLYLVDETGKPQKSIDYKAGNDATFTEGTDVSSYIINKLAACRYGFDVKAGKTYVLFQNNATLGFYGFTFGASSTEATNVSISQNNNGYTYEAKNNATVTLTKPLTANVWNAICLPFSMTEQQVRNAFGENARIAEFKKVDERKDVALFGMHYYQLITAGKPCLIKPSQVSETYTIEGVTIDAEKALTIDDPNKKFDFVGTYATTSMPVNSHFLGSADGKLYYITTAKNISGLKAFLRLADNNSGAKLSIAFDSTDNNQDNNTTGIEAIKDYTDQDAANSSANKGIYNINGQFMGTNPAILPQGIYVKNGKKFIVK